MKKKMIAMVLAAVMAMGMLAGCGGDSGSGSSETPEATKEAADEAQDTQEPAQKTEAKTDGWVIGYICKDLSQEWFINTLDALKAKALDLGASDVIALDCEMNPEKCLTNLDNLISQKVDIIIICVPDQELSQTVADRCSAAGIPVFADADGLIVDGKHIAPALELNAYKVGSSMGEWLAGYVNENMDLKADQPETGYMRMTMNEVSSCVPRADGAKDAFLKDCPDFTEENIIDANYDGTTEQGYDVAAATITAHPEIKKWIVTAPNDEGASGATRALEAVGLDKEACVVGAGAYLAVDEFQKESSAFKAAAYFSPVETGEQEATAAIEYLKDGTEIFGDYKDTYEGDNEYGVYPLGGVMVTKDNYKEEMGNDAK